MKTTTKSLSELFYQKKSAGKAVNEELCLQDDGMYWYLYPYFAKLYERTGKMVDLYGIAHFAQDTLSEFDIILEEALQATAKQPDEWEQKTGTLIKPEKEVLYDKVSKDSVLSTIRTLKAIINKGINVNAVVVFEGN